MPDLPEFLTARLDEDKAIAKRVFRSVLTVDGFHVLSRGWPGNPPMPVADAIDNETAEHIARHDAARVLREVEAKRKILTLHKISTEYEPTRDENEQFIRVPQLYCAVCGWASDVEGSGCATLRAVVAVYSDHPDYDPAWEPA